MPFIKSFLCWKNPLTNIFYLYYYLIIYTLSNYSKFKKEQSNEFYNGFWYQLKFILSKSENENLIPEIKRSIFTSRIF